MSHPKKKPAGPDRTLVEEFSLIEDRADPAVFVGRQDIIQDIEANCRAAMRRVRNGEKAAGKTFLIQGAPGAGKSALLSHLVKRWDGREGCPMVLELDADTLEDTSATALEIVKKIAPGQADRFRRRSISTGTASRGIPTITSAVISTSRETEAEDVSLSIVKEVKPPEKWKQPLCIRVDEIQKVGEEHGATIRALQLGTHKLPIIPIYAGLADSEEKLQEIVSPRLQTGNTRNLSALAPEEVHSCVKQMLDQCRIDYTSDQLKHLADGIAERSEGWPQHLHTETAALFRGLHKADCDLRAVDFDTVKDRAGNYRKESCRKRQSTRMSDSVHLVAAVMRELPTDGMHRSEVLKSIRDKTRPEEAGPGLPKGMTAEDFRDHLIHQGALQPDEDDMLTCPIPSLRTWLIDQSSALQDQGKPCPDPTSE